MPIPSIREHFAQCRKEMEAAITPEERARTAKLAEEFFNPARENVFSEKVAKMIESGELYVMTMDDVHDRAWSQVFTRYDFITGLRWASWKSLPSDKRWNEVAVDVPLCGSCDAPVSEHGKCSWCEE